MSNPEYVKCVHHPHADHEHESWCGRTIRSEWAFTGLDHVAVHEGRLLACSNCLDAAIQAIQKSRYTGNDE